ncbi:MAG: SMEK domain-containing protein [Lachnospiraceae bacterium]|nr:SMEK domain-containing protein [Lachnospiraceae bacterium]
MAEVTREFIKDEDINIELVSKQLEKVASSINRSNKKNLTDINIICEEVFGKILNKIYGYNLFSASAEIKGNFMAVDLIDYENRVCYQVTTRKDRKKIGDTIKKFNQTNLENDIDELNILIIGEKSKYHEPLDLDLSNGKKFSLMRNIYDNKSLIDLIQKKEYSNPGFLVEIYDDINMVFDSGRVSTKSIVKATEEFSDCYEYEEGGVGEKKFWKKGLGDTQIIAFIPLSYEAEISCLLLIRKSSVSGSSMTFGQKTLLENYFVTEEEFKQKHNVGRFSNEEQIYMQIENTRMQINAHTGYHIYQLFEALKNEYLKEQRKIEQTLGVEKFRKVGSDYYLTTISEIQWKEMYFFAKNHQSHIETGELDWNIFKIGWMDDHLVFAKNSLDRRHADDFARIDVRVSKEYENMLDVFWRPGYAAGRGDMEGFDNIIKWRADYTLKWIMEKFIPKAHEFYPIKKKHSLLKWFEKN